MPGLPEVLIILAVPLLIVLAVVGRGFRVNDEYVAKWASSAGIELGPDSEPVVRRYLAWSRRCRTAGGLIGFLAPGIYSEVVNGEPLRDGGWSVSLMLIGYLLGAVVAEVIVDRRDRRPGSETVVFRRLRDYLSATAVRLQRGLGVLSAVLVLVYAIVEPHARMSVPDVAFVGSVGAGGASLALVIEIIQRTVIARRREMTGTGGVAIPHAVDDAVRSSSAHVLAGGGIALLFNVVGPMALLCLLAPVGSGNLAGPIVFVFFAAVFPTSLLFWSHFVQHHGFKVRRADPQAIAS